MELNHWIYDLDDREKLSVQHASDYARLYAGAGIPGHSLLMLIDKMAKLLNEREHALLNVHSEVVVQQIVYSSADNCWKDVLTGIRTEINDRYNNVPVSIPSSLEDVKSDH